MSLQLEPTKLRRVMAGRRMPPTAFSARTASKMAGVGAGADPSTTSNPFPAKTSATRSAN